jgi:epoxide hydrolase-like predicted phosphatase
MAIRAVVFDIGGVLEFTPRTGWVETWEAQLNLGPGSLKSRLKEVWQDGSIGNISEADVETRIGAILGLGPAQVQALMADVWEEYLGTQNVELTTYFAHLRPTYKTAILSNSFVGAREKEHARYQFGDLCDLIIYSHEVGLQKPERRIFELTCERLGVAPHEVVFLDDVEPSVVAARELGMQAILFQNTAQAIADIDSCLQAFAS